MTDDEWRGVCFLIEQGWGEFDDKKRMGYRAFLDAYSVEAVLTALHRIAQTGKPFLPKVPELVKAIRDVSVPPVPSWAEAWSVIKRAMSRSGRKRPVEVGVREAMEWLRGEAHPVVAAFVEVEGLRQLAMTEFGDPEWGPARLTNLEKRWKEFVGVANERLERGLAIESHARRAIGPGRFDPSKALSFIQEERKGLPPASGDPPS